MNKSKIEYLKYQWTPVSGCRNWEKGICGGNKDFSCWAKAMITRFPAHYPYGFEPTFYSLRLMEPFSLMQPSRIGVSFMGDLFGDWMQGKIHKASEGNEIEGTSAIEAILNVAHIASQHTFLFLTKCPWNLAKWSPFSPPNCWVGVSATNIEQFKAAIVGLTITEAKIKYISFEPLLEFIPIKSPYTLDGIDWAIIGSATGRRAKPPELEWVKEIIETADKAGCKIFLKNNLLKVFPALPKRQEFPMMK